MKTSTLSLKSLGIVLFVISAVLIFTFVMAGNNNDESLKSEYLVGKWKVTYTDPEFTGAIIYDIKKEEQECIAYTHEYADSEGNSMPAEGTKILTILSFDGSKGRGIYYLEYEGEVYGTECTISKTGDDSFTLTYDYQGYSNTETWKRQ